MQVDFKSFKSRDPYDGPYSLGICCCYCWEREVKEREREEREGERDRQRQRELNTQNSADYFDLSHNVALINIYCWRTNNC